MALAKNKKGIFYTIIAVSLMGLLIYAFSLSFAPKMQQHAKITESVVFAMDRFFDDVEDDMERAAHITAFRAILSMEEHIFDTGTFIGDGTPGFDQAFEELFFNGTMGGTPYVLMENNTFTNWTTKMILRANDLYIVMNYSVNTFSVYQDNPWSFKVDVNLSLDLQDQLQFARFDRDIFVTAEIDIEDFDDPFYVVKTNQDWLVKFRQSPYDNKFVLNGDDTTNLNLHINGTYYIESPIGPSFLMRFSDNLGASEHGLESFISESIMADLVESKCPYTGLQNNLHNRSQIDHIYCNATSFSMRNFSAVNMSPNFRIDNITLFYNNSFNISHIARYGLENLSGENP